MKPDTLFHFTRNALLVIFTLSTFQLLAEEQPEIATSDEEQQDVALLLKIAYINLRQRERKLVDIPLTPGEYESPEKGKVTDRIAFYPGSPILHGRRPKDRLVQLYRGTGKKRILLGSLHIRYYARKKNIWFPRFKIEQNLVPVRVGNTWRLISDIPGASEPLVLTGNAIPNAEGYYPRLKVGIGGKRFLLDSWTVK
jgi:hypothetical protein